MAKFRFLPNTPLKFSRFEDLTNVLQTEQNRSEFDYQYNGRLFHFIPTFFDSKDALFFQFRTDYTDFSINLLNKQGAIIGSLTKKLLLTYPSDGLLAGIRLYQVDLDLSSLRGLYYINITCYQVAMPVLTFNSELFHVELNSKKLKLSWFGSTSLNDPFIWDSTPACMRIEAELKNKYSVEDRSTYVDTDGNIENTYALPRNSRMLVVRNVPEYLMSMLELIISHDEFYINNVPYGADASWEYEAKSNRTYSPTLKLTQKDYWDYN